MNVKNARTKSFGRRVFCALAVFLAGAANAQHSFAQGLGTLSGTVTDPSGAEIQSAAVVATQTDTGATTTVRTNGNGAYVFPSLAPTGYSLSVTAPGFKVYVQKGIVLQANQSATVNAVLQLGEPSQTVMVVANAVQVDTTTGTLSQVIDRKSVNDLPLNGDRKSVV
jgi:hypothetical protein